MLIAKNISKTYDRGAIKENKALLPISLSFAKVGLVSIFGPSGCGKTTLLNILSGLDKPTTGSVVYNDAPVDDSFRYSNIGCIFQEFLLLDEETVADNIRIGYDEVTSEEIDDALSALGILDLKDRRVSKLSGGERQRVAIARAILKKPAYIIADEPTGNLDSDNSKNVMEILKSLSKRFLILFVSHDRGLVEDYSDRVITMRDGEILSDRLIHETPEQTSEIKHGKKKGLFGALSKTFSLKKRTNVFAGLTAAVFVGLVSLGCSQLSGYSQSIVGVGDNCVSLSRYGPLSSQQYSRFSSLGHFVKSGYAPSETYFYFPSNGLKIDNPDYFTLTNIPISAQVKEDEKVLFGETHDDIDGVYLSKGYAEKILREAIISSGSVSLSLSGIGITEVEQLLGATVKFPVDSVKEESIIGIVDGSSDAFYYSKASLSYLSDFDSTSNPTAISTGKYHYFGSTISKSFYRDLTGIDLSQVQDGVYGLFDTAQNSVHLSDGTFTSENSVSLGTTYALSSGQEVNLVLSDYDFYNVVSPYWFISDDIGAAEDYLTGQDIEYSNLHAALAKSAATNTLNFFLYFLTAFLLSLALSLAFLLLDLSSYTKASLLEVAVLRSLGIGRWEVIFAYLGKTLLRLLPSFAVGYLSGTALAFYIRTYNLYTSFAFLLNFWVLILALLVGGAAIALTVFLYYVAKFDKTATSLKVSAKI